MKTINFILAILSIILVPFTCVFGIYFFRKNKDGKIYKPFKHLYLWIYKGCGKNYMPIFGLI